MNSPLDCSQDLRKPAHTQGAAEISFCILPDNEPQRALACLDSIRRHEPGAEVIFLHTGPAAEIVAAMLNAVRPGALRVLKAELPAGDAGRALLPLVLTEVFKLARHSWLAVLDAGTQLARPLEVPAQAGPEVLALADPAGGCFLLRRNEAALGLVRGVLAPWVAQALRPGAARQAGPWRQGLELRSVGGATVPGKVVLEPGLRSSRRLRILSRGLLALDVRGEQGLRLDEVAAQALPLAEALTAAEEALCRAVPEVRLQSDFDGLPTCDQLLLVRHWRRFPRLHGAGPAVRLGRWLAYPPPAMAADHGLERLPLGQGGWMAHWGPAGGHAPAAPQRAKAAPPADPHDRQGLLDWAAEQDPVADYARVRQVFQSYLDIYPLDYGVWQRLSLAQDARYAHMLAHSERLEQGFRPRNFKVSAVISTYASQEFMAECLAELAKQTLAEELEVIVIDAASPQDERQTVLQAMARQDNIRYVRTPERIRIYEAWNLGMRLATAPYTTPFSTNDKLRAEGYAILHAALEADPEAMIAFGDSLLSRTPHESFEDVHARLLAGHNTSIWMWNDYSWVSNMQHCTVGPQPMWRTALPRTVGHFDERYLAIADQEYWLRVGGRHKILHVPEITGLAWLTTDSLSGQSSAIAETTEIQDKYQRVLAAAFAQKFLSEQQVPCGREGAAAGAL